MKITIWDDDNSAAESWKSQIEKLRGNDCVSAPAAKEIQDELEILHSRRSCYLDRDSTSEIRDSSMLDETDILIVDNDLFGLDKFVDMSAEMVATRALVYTKCPFIVVLNLSPDIDFDLSLLGHMNSKADLHLNDRFIGNSGLWLECPLKDGGFRPWNWPLLHSVVGLQRSRIAELEEFINEKDNFENTSILDYFGFSKSSRNRLSRTTKAFLHPTKAVNRVTFKDFLDNNAKAIDIRDAAMMIGKNDVTRIARVCARRISKWLSHLVAGPQDVLIDLPHLISEFPFFVPVDKRKKLEGWNFFASLNQNSTTGLLEDISEKQFKRAIWFDRPVFWREQFNTEEYLDRFLQFTSEGSERPIFCEDASSFHPSNQCNSFVAGFHSTSDNRFIRWFDSESGINYGPYSRMAM